MGAAVRRLAQTHRYSFRHERRLSCVQVCSQPGNPQQVRIRITHKLSGSIDGIQLDRFVPGCVYVVGTSLGSYLLAIGGAEPVADESPALLTPLAEQMARPPAALRRCATVTLFDQAADRGRRKKAPRR